MLEGACPVQCRLCSALARIPALFIGTYSLLWRLSLARGVSHSVGEVSLASATMLCGEERSVFWSGMAWLVPSVGIDRDTSLRSISPERPVLTLGWRGLL
ncbi:hypothetical protein HDV64DRAFT_244995 [Trichoderma sp. TUCIM 5745]